MSKTIEGWKIIELAHAAGESLVDCYSDPSGSDDGIWGGGSRTEYDIANELASRANCEGKLFDGDAPYGVVRAVNKYMLEEPKL